MADKKTKRFKSVTINFPDTSDGREQYFALKVIADNDDRSMAKTAYRALANDIGNKRLNFDEAQNGDLVRLLNGRDQSIDWEFKPDNVEVVDTL